MFSDRFKREMENIKPDEGLKLTVTTAMKDAVRYAEVIRNKAIIVRLKWTASVAAMVAICLISVSVWNNLGVIPVISNGDYGMDPASGEDYEEPTYETAAEPNINTPNSYDDIFNYFSEDSNDSMQYEDETEEENDYWESNGPTTSTALGTTGRTPSIKNNTGNTDDGNSTETNTTPQKTEFSETNTQEIGIDESDIVKTDGKYIYILKSWQDKVLVALPTSGKFKKCFSFQLENVHLNGQPISYDEMYVRDGRLIALGETYTENGIPRTVASFYNIENPEKPLYIDSLSQTGKYISSRVADGVLYMFSAQSYNNFSLNKGNLKTYIPFISTKDKENPISTNNIYLFDCEKAASQTYLVACSMKCESAEFISSKAVLGGGDDIYASAKSVYAVRTVKGKDGKNTSIIRFALSGDGSIRPVAKSEVKGEILNQFSLAESDDGFFRIVTTLSSSKSQSNSLYILNDELEQVSSIENIAPGEKIFSARLSGDIGYFVTYKEVDPLFAVDLTDPENPKILSSLKIPGFSNYLHPYGDGLLLGIGKDSNDRGYIKLSMFDVSDPTDVTQKHSTVLSEITNAAVNSNHKAALISTSKNIIVFGAGYDGDFYIYSYGSNGFVKKAVLKAPSDTCSYNRALYIGDYLYICSHEGIISYDMQNGFKRIETRSFS